MQQLEVESGCVGDVKLPAEIVGLYTDAAIVFLVELKAVVVLLGKHVPSRLIARREATQKKGVRISQSQNIRFTPCVYLM